MKRFVALEFLLAATLGLLAGCVQFDYVGQEFTPTPKDTPMNFYTQRSELPRDEYRVIGRATMTVPDGTDGYDIQEMLTDKARSYGADAVCLISSERVRVGTYEIPQNVMPGPEPYVNAGNVNVAGQPYQINTFGAETSTQGEIAYREEVVVKALFLKNREAVDKILAERKEELHDIENDEPVPADLLKAAGIDPEQAEKGAQTPVDSEDSVDEAVIEMEELIEEVQAEKAKDAESADKASEKAKDVELTDKTSEKAASVESKLPVKDEKQGKSEVVSTPPKSVVADPVLPAENKIEVKEEAQKASDGKMDVQK